MTVTLKPWMVALLIATVCVLAGFAAGQITSAQSGTATVSASDRYYLRQMDRTLDKIEDDTHETCRALVKYKFVCN